MVIGKARYIAARIIGAIIILVLFGLLIMQFPGVQTGLAHYAVEKFQGAIDGRLEIGSVKLHPFNAVTLKDVTIIDENPCPDRYSLGCGTLDTLAHIGKLSATISPLSFFRKSGIRIGRVDAEDVLFQLAMEHGEEYSLNVTRIFRINGGSDNPMTLDSLFTIHRVNVKNARYRMVNFGQDPSTRSYGIDFGNLDLSFDLKAHDVSMHDARVFATVDKLSARENRCGYTIKNLTAACGVGAGRTNIWNIHYEDGDGSRLYLPRVDFNYYDNPSAWGNFIQDVELDIDIGRSHLVFGSISAYSGNVFHGCPLQAEIESASFKGPVSNFKVTDLVFRGTECDVSGTVSCAISGIPSTSKMFLDAELKDVRFTTEGLKKVLEDVGAHADLSNLAPGTVFTANGTAQGLLSELGAKLNLTSPIGNMRIDGKTRNITVAGKKIEFQAALAGESFDLGKLLGNSALGAGTFTATADGRLGDPLMLRLHDLNIKSLTALGYEYTDINLTARMIGSAAQIKLDSADSNAMLGLTANVDWKKRTGRIEAEINDLDLATLGLDKRGGKSAVSCIIAAEQGLLAEEPAQILISDLTLTSDDGTHNVGDIEALARLHDGRLTATVASSAFDAKYNGTSNIAALVKDLRAVTVDRHLPAYFAPGAAPADTLSTVDCSLNATFRETKGLLAFLLPGMAIENGTAVNIDLDNSGRLMGYISSPGISYNNIVADSFDISMDNLDGTLDCTVSADRLIFGNLPFNRAAFMVQAASDLLSTSLTYDNAGVLDGGSELYIDAAFSRDASDSLLVDVFTRPSQISIKGQTWDLEESTVNLSSTRVAADGFMMSCGEQSISLEGGVSPRGTDTLAVRIREFDLDLINDFALGKIPQLQGLLDGDVTLLSPLPSEMGLFAALDLTGLTVDGINAGNFRLDSDWDDKNRIITLGLDNYFADRNALSLGGTYNTRSKQIAATAKLDSLDAAVAGPFIKNILSDFGGMLHGELSATGTPDRIKLASDGLRLDGIRGKVYYTKVTYILDGTVSVSDNNINFNNIGVKDEYGGMGILTGHLALGDFKKPRIDANLDMNRLKAIDIPNANSPILIYGDLAVSGSGRVRGAFSALGIDADVVSAGSGTVNVPIPNTSSATNGNLLTFKAPEKPEGEDGEQEEVYRRASGVTLHTRARISPEVIANVEVDRESGHGLTASGTGDVVLDLNTSKSKLQLKGDYLIDKGKYLFNIPGVVSKEFDIKQGSSIKLNGDVMESTLDIKAVHNVKTSLNSIVADSTHVSSRRNVECGLNIGGRLRNPEVSFSINVPDLDPSTQMAVNSALNTTDKVQKQFVALLLLGTFIPEENSGIVNGSNMLYSNVGEIVAGQLNNILQKLDIPLDFGFGYQQDEIGTDIFDVAVSTQLFNNRLVVGGSVGNRRYSTSKNAYGDIVGDLDIELKLDNSGNLRFKLFSHSADEYTSSLDFSQRNGLGFSYQKEFNHALEFIKDLFKSRSRKAQEALEEAGRKKEKKIINIE
ncbi:MAG: translocation/assembly module TamB domain-containing protein [Bacteroidales bacterium]|nr:translocation/assembly module TamB domain-containing protein [Bacteroidales bacterium]